MPFLGTPSRRSPLVSRQELDQNLFNLFLNKESIDTQFPPQLLGAETIRAAWALLVARYAQADSLNIQTQNINETRTVLTSTTIFSLENDEPLQNVLQQARKISGADICLTNESVHSFPLAERHLAKLSSSFQTALVAVSHPAGRRLSHILTKLSSHQIIVRHDLEKLSIWVDPRLTSAIADPDLPCRLLGQLELIAWQLVHQHTGSSLPVVGDLEYFSAVDKHDAATKDPALKPSVRKLLHEVISSVASLRPNAPAICSWDADLTYRELDQLSTKLAHHLYHAGVRPGMMVPLLFEKSAYTHVAQLAVLKAGGVITTLPADMPLARISSIVAQLVQDIDVEKPALGLCSPSLAEILTPLVSRIIAVNAESVARIKDDTKPTVARVRPDDPAYVIFTSGTTGVPKGVVVEHRNVCSSCQYFGRDLMKLGRHGVRQSQFLSYAFDGSIHETFYTLSNGGCLCVLSEDERMNDIAGAMTRMGVTHAKFTPSIVDQLSPGDFPTVQKLFLGGEPLTTACVDRWRPQVEVWNNYGPAECTVQSTVISCANPQWVSGVIGHAGASRCFVVDPKNPHRRMPRGCIGEIAIEGPNVSRGYLRNLAQTERAFVQGLVWAEDPSRRFYRTGDMGYLDSYGLLICKGRNDDQIKINGQRIELGEVETQLQLVLPGASRGVVDAVELSGLGKRLVAFVQLDESLGVNSKQIEARVRDDLIDVLPPAFVPSHVLQIEEIPMGNTGKTDRKALRQLGRGLLTEQLEKQTQVLMASVRRDEVPVAHSSSRETEENLLRQMWAETLQLPIQTLHLKSDFFLSGGTSLLAMRLAAMARKRSWDLNVKKIFANPILNDMLQAITLTTLSTDKSSSFRSSPQLKSSIAQDWKLRGEQIEEIYPATPIQESFLALAEMNHGAYIMQYTFSIPGDADCLQLQHSWRCVNEAHPILRTRFYTTATGLYQVVLKDDFLWKELKGTDSIEFRRRAKSEILLPLQPLSLFHLLTDDQTGARVLLWTVSHALTDGWTSSRLFAEVHAIYTHGAPVPRADPYINFVNSLATTPESVDGFWERELDHGPVMEYPILPYAQFRPATNSRIEGYQSIASRSSTSRYTVPLIVRAAWAITISEMTQQEDVMFGVSLSGRHEYPDVVGPTVTTVPLRATVQPSLCIKDLLGIMFDQSVRMMPFEQTGLRRISEIASGRLQPYCKFQSSLVVQLPREEVVGVRENAMDWMHPEKLDTVSAHGLVVNCLVRSSGVDVWMNYDGRVLDEEEIQKLMTGFLDVLSQILSADDEQTIAGLCAQVQVFRSNPCNRQMENPQMGRAIKYLGRSIDATHIESEMAGIINISVDEIHLNMIRPDKHTNYSVLTAFIATDDLKCFARYVTELQSHMGKSLPSYMIPTRYVPLTTNERLISCQEVLEKVAWKYDTYHNPSPAAKANPANSAPAVTNLSPVEQILMDCWSQVLGRNDISVNDSFLLLGGDSIKVMRLVSAARAANLRLSVAFALQNPLFRRMAAGAEMIESQAIQEVPPWSLLGGKTDLSCVRDQIEKQTGYDFDSLEDVSPVTPYQKSTFLDSLRTPGTCVLQTRYQLHSNFDFMKMQRAWQQVSRIFTSLRTRLARPKNWDMVQVIVPDATKPIAMHFPTLGELQDHMQQTSLSMTRLGACLNEVFVAHVDEEQEQYLVWTVHHAVFDSNTLQQIREALVEAYYGETCTHQPVALREYISYLQDQDSTVAERYWLRYLKGADASVFPFYPSPEYVVRPHNTHRQVLTLRRSMSRSISMATMIHGAWGMVLSSLTRTRDVTYQHLLSGRTAAADKIDRFAGPTISLVPVRIKIQERLNSTVQGFLAEIQAQAAEMMLYTSLGLEKIAGLMLENKRIFDFHHMLVIHNKVGEEAKSEKKGLPMRELESSMNLDGYLGLIVQCTITPLGVNMDLRWDEKLIPQPLIDILAPQVVFFFVMNAIALLLGHWE
ncbi:Nonribosomal peptide synthetase 1 [Penicillium rolfsii]|nr:Nonribosomal peptide synthetase 1 [Penicillium rolfsii]